MGFFGIFLYELLPALYRIRDAEQGYKLRGLLEIISQQADILKQDINGLWDDLFIETCHEWVIPYIADLVGNNPLHEVGARRRADVAKTIYYRRRKGTLPMLEEMARDVTGWGAHVVAFFELLGWTQNLNHLRYKLAPNPEDGNPNAAYRVGTVNLRNLDALDLLDGPLDIVSHSVDVRSIGRTEGWYGIRKIGFFLWRIRNYPVGIVGDKSENESDDLIEARQSQSHAYGYYFSPLGNPAPLFNKPEIETDEAGLAGEINLPGPIRPLAFCLRTDDYYGDNRSLCIVKDGSLVSPADIVSQDLSNWDRPTAVGGKKVAVDVKMGRIAFSCWDEPTEHVRVYYNYGFSADLGGGPYERRDTLRDPDQDEWNTVVSKYGVVAGSVSTLQQAIKDWADPAKGNKRSAVITIADNATYEEAICIELAEGKCLTIQAANQKRPHLRLPKNSVLDVNVLEVKGEGGSKLILNGLLIEGGIHIDELMEELSILHSTLVPGLGLNEVNPKEPDSPTLVEPKERNSPSLFVHKDNKCLHIEIDHSIAGALRLPEGMAGLTVRDSIIDAGIREDKTAIASSNDEDLHGPPAILERVTIFGKVHVRELTLASEAIFTDIVQAQRSQAGCVRFSYVPEDSKTPRRYRCQPDLALDQQAENKNRDLTRLEKEDIFESIRPMFTSVHYGDPAYAQLSLNCAEEIRTGAEDGSEMGVFCSLKQPQREANLRIRLEEYLPFGLDAGIIKVT
ncbi:MAG: hypothetical protein ABIN58_09630 [candidate division WOR-3 bacterium]